MILSYIQKKMQLGPAQEKKPKHIVLNSPSSAFTDSMSIKLLDGLGRAIDKPLRFKLLDDYSCEVDFTDLPLGVYYVQVVDEQSFFIKRVNLGETLS